MQWQQEITLTAWRELRRNLKSTKGIAMFVLFFLGGAIASLIPLWIAKIKKDNNIPTELIQSQQEAFFSKVYGDESGKYLSTLPNVLYFLFQLTIYALPVLCLLIGFDLIAGEIQHRSIRYVAGRAERHNLVIGKFFGVWGVIAVMVFVLHSVLWMAMLIQGVGEAGQIFSWGGRVYLFSVLFACPYIGIICLVSSFFRTPVVSLFGGAAVLFGIFSVYVLLIIMKAFESTKDAASNLQWGFPQKYEYLLLSPDPKHWVGGVALLLLWGAVCVGGACEVIRRRDI
jgi:ABC-type transport system involved in multi-copper enzyme maturation permease subunit